MTWRCETLRNLAIVTLVCLTNSSSTSQNAMDVTSILPRLVQLENLVAKLQTQYNSQEKKYAAIMSNILSKLSAVTVDASSAKNEVTFLKKDVSDLWKESNATARHLDLISNKMVSSSDIRKHQAKLENQTLANKGLLEELTLNFSQSNILINTVSQEVSQLPQIQSAASTIENDTRLFHNNLTNQNADIARISKTLALIAKAMTNVTAQANLSRHSLIQNTYNLSVLATKVENVERAQHVIVVKQSSLEANMASLGKVVNDVKANQASKTKLSHLTQSVHTNILKFANLTRTTIALEKDVNNLKSSKATKSEFKTLTKSVTKNTKDIGTLNNAAKGAVFQVRGVTSGKPRPTFNNVDLNVGRGFHHSSNEFAAPASGSYMFIVMSRNTGRNGEVATVSIFRGHQKIESASFRAGETLTFTSMMDLTSGETVHVEFSTQTRVYVKFTGFRIG